MWNATHTFQSQSVKLSAQKVPEEHFVFPAFVLSFPIFSPYGDRKNIFQYIKFSQFSNPGGWHTFQRAFSFSLLPETTVVMESETLHENACPPEAHFCQLYKAQRKVTQPTLGSEDQSAALIWEVPP